MGKFHKLTQEEKAEVDAIIEEYWKVDHMYELTRELCNKALAAYKGGRVVEALNRHKDTLACHLAALEKRKRVNERHLAFLEKIARAEGWPVPKDKDNEAGRH